MSLKGPLTPSDCTTIKFFCSVMDGLYSSKFTGYVIGRRVAFLRKFIRFKLFFFEGIVFTPSCLNWRECSLKVRFCLVVNEVNSIYLI